MAVMLMLGYVDLLTYFGQEQCNVCVWVKGDALNVILDYKGDIKPSGNENRNCYIQTCGWLATKITYHIGFYHCNAQQASYQVKVLFLFFSSMRC